MLHPIVDKTIFSIVTGEVGEDQPTVNFIEEYVYDKTSRITSNDFLVFDDYEKRVAVVRSIEYYDGFSIGFNIDQHGIADRSMIFVADKEDYHGNRNILENMHYIAGRVR